MCLDTVDEKPARKFGVGYKQVRKTALGTYVCFDHIPHADSVTYPLNQWITDPNDGDVHAPSPADPKYRTGFHISLDKRNMLKCVKIWLREGDRVVIKVRFRKVTATQIDRPDGLYGHQVVAREIMNLGEV